MRIKQGLCDIGGATLKYLSSKLRAGTKMVKNPRRQVELQLTWRLNALFIYLFNLSVHSLKQ